MTNLRHVDHIAFLTTVYNFKLYKKSSLYHPEGVRRYIIDGRNGMYGIHSIVYMMQMLWEEDIDWLIMLDEDVIVLDFGAIEDLIKYMHHNSYVLAGMQDGGVHEIRHHSPYAINTYFSILDFKKVKQFWNKEEVLKNQYIFKNEFQINNQFIRHNYDENSLFEGYYCFYFWLLRQGQKLLYLNAEQLFKDDVYTNVLYNHNNEPLLYHTWHARSFGVSKVHTKRISRVFSEAQTQLKPKGVKEKPVIFKDKSFKGYVHKNSLKKRVKRLLKKLISGFKL
ncbi:hypothetical protein [Winogradskyella aurantiaca]|uniref:hypothetical protein n=1 Tax=Winogradskyella aurantiaca TaxID=2219558 RepID=UPI000E1CCBC8|nr:hypothetical protein [Winogradskyella aurantiaca]